MASRANLRWLVHLAVAGCSSSAPLTRSSPTPLKHEVREQRETLAARAEQALADDTVLDYERPLVAKPDPRSHTLVLFAEACRAGDVRSCRSAVVFAARDDKLKYADAVTSHCRAGDLLSCRALPNDEQNAHPIDAPGRAGRSWACHDTPDRAGCDFDAAKRECDAGSIESCRVVLATRPSRQVFDEVQKRIATRSREGCDAGLIDECVEQLDTLASNWSARQFAIARERCQKQRSCGQLGQMLMDQNHDLTGARDAFEIACQYREWPVGDCMSLGLMYLDGKLAEPVAGRGQALLDRECRLLLDAFKTREDVIRNRPACKRAKRE